MPAHDPLLNDLVELDARYLRISQDLSDVDSVSTARTNLGLGNLAVLDSLSHGALTGVGASDHHARYTDAEAVTAVAVDDSYVKIAGDSMTGALTMTVDDTDDYVPLTITNNDVTNNPNTLVVTNATTSNAISIDQNGNVGTDVAINGAVHIENTGNTGIGLGVYSNIGATADAALVFIQVQNPAFDQRGIYNVYDGSFYAQENHVRGGGMGLRINITDTPLAASRKGIEVVNTQPRTNAETQLLDFTDTSVGSTIEMVKFRALNNDCVVLLIDQDVTNANHSAKILDITSTSIVDDGGTYTKSGSVVDITSNVTETSGVITDSAILLNIDQQHSDASGASLKVASSGTGNTVEITHSVTTSGQAVYIARDGEKELIRLLNRRDGAGEGGIALFSRNLASGDTARPVVQIVQDHASDDQDTLSLKQDGTGNALSVDQNGNTGTAVATDGAVHIENTGNTGIGLGVYTNIGATADGPLVSIHTDNAAFDQPTVRIKNDTTDGIALQIGTGGVTERLKFGDSVDLRGNVGHFDVIPVFASKQFRILNPGGTVITCGIDFDSGSIAINNDSAALSFDIDQDVTNVNSGNGSFKIVNTSVVTDAGTYTKSGSIVTITSGVTETSGVITDTAIVLDINQTHADATGNVVDIANAGEGILLNLSQTNVNGGVVIQIDNQGDREIMLAEQKVLLENNRHFFNLINRTVAQTRAGNSMFAVYDNQASTLSTYGLAQFRNEGVSSTSKVATFLQKGTGTNVVLDTDGTGKALLVDHDDTGTNPSVDIDRDGNNAADITGLKINVANAGAGGGIALDTTGGWLVGTARYTTTQTLNADDHIVYCDTDGGAWTLTLPAGTEGQHFKIINCGSSGNTLTVDPDGTEQLYGAGAGVASTLSDGEIINIHYQSTEGWW